MLAKGTEIILRNGLKGRVEAVFGHRDMLEYRVRVGKSVLYLTQDEILAQVSQSGTFRVNMSVNSCHVR